MSFQFASPWVLLLAVFVPTILAARYLWLKKNTKPATFQHSAASFVTNISKSWRIKFRPLLVVMRFITIFMALVALARPQIVQGRETISGEGVEIALALDVSGSMASLDFQPNNRLEAAKDVISDFVSKRAYDQIGLVIFSNEAFNQSPLTLDHRMLERSLDQVQLATDLGIEDGTAIGLGIANAANMLANSDNESRVIILLTDGVNNAGQIDPLTAAEAAKALGIKVYTVGAAKPGMVPVPVQGLLGGAQIVQQESTLDEATLQQVADITGGLYFRAEDSEGLKAIYDEINNLEQSKIEVQVFNQYHELAGWLIVPALMIFFTELFLRKSVFRKIP